MSEWEEDNGEGENPGDESMSDGEGSSGSGGSSDEVCISCCSLAQFQVTH